MNGMLLARSYPILPIFGSRVFKENDLSSCCTRSLLYIVVVASRFVCWVYRRSSRVSAA